MGNIYTNLYYNIIMVFAINQVYKKEFCIKAIIAQGGNDEMGVIYCRRDNRF